MKVIRITAAMIGLAVGGASCCPSSMAAVKPGPPRAEYHAQAEFDQILRENALFFDMLVSFSFTAGVADPVWSCDVKDININLITRAVRDPQGHQIVRVRVAGVVRSNNNVELNLLDENGSLVGQGFYGYDSGQLSFFDANGRTIITGYVDWDGSFFLYDQRLPEGKRDLARGFVDPCFYCGALEYGWYDGTGAEVGGGLMYPSFYTDDASHVRMGWSFEVGSLGPGQPAYGGAEYELENEATGAINSVLFDTARTARSFFENPYALVPEPVGQAMLPRVTNQTGIAVSNPSGGEIEITYVARHYSGAVVAGEGIENPVSYRFAPGLQLAAFPAEIFRGFSESDLRPVFGDGEVGWVEVFSYDGDVQAVFLEGDVAAAALDGNIGGRGGDPVLMFPDLRIGSGEGTEIELLNLSFDDVMVRLQLLDGAGRVLREEQEEFIAGYGIRSFVLGPGSALLGGIDPSQVASLRVSCNNDNSIKSSSCERLIGLATCTDSFRSLATYYAVTAASAGSRLLGPQFAVGPAGSGSWSTSVQVTKLDGGPASVYLDIFDTRGDLQRTLRQEVASLGRATFVIDSTDPAWSDRLVTGYVRVRSDSGNIGGDVSVRWFDGRGSMYSSYPLSNSLHSDIRFNQVAQGRSDRIEFWTGVAMLNDLDRRVEVLVEVFTPESVLDRSATVRLEPYQQYNALLSQILNDPAYTRLDGYMRVRATDPISAIVLYGDSTNRFLSAVPGVSR
jgi:hypothetical protein